MLENWPYNQGQVPQVKQNVLLIENLMLSIKQDNYLHYFERPTSHGIQDSVFQYSDQR